MNIVINGVDLGRRRGGNEVYLRGLISALRNHPDVHRLSVITVSHNAQLPELPELENVDTLNVGKYNRASFLLWKQTLALNKLPCDWFLSTYFLPPVLQRRSALFVHDLSFRALSYAYPLAIMLYMRILTVWAMLRTQCIIVPSHFVKDELRRFYPRLANRSYVIYPGISPEFVSEKRPSDRHILERYRLSSGYILSVSSIHPRKNMRSLFEAHQMLSKWLGELCPPLVLVGQRYWGGKEIEEYAALGLQIHWLGYVPDEDLPALYRHASVFVYPSIYEGFGLPPLEAMACGVPVVCGDHAPFPETVSDCALRVNVRDPAAIAFGVQQLIKQNEIRAKLVELGLHRSKDFRWERTADRIVQLLKSMS